MMRVGSLSQIMKNYFKDIQFDSEIFGRHRKSLNREMVSYFYLSRATCLQNLCQSWWEQKQQATQKSAINQSRSSGIQGSCSGAAQGVDGLCKSWRQYQQNPLMEGRRGRGRKFRDVPRFLVCIPIGIQVLLTL